MQGHFFVFVDEIIALSPISGLKAVALSQIFHNTSHHCSEPYVTEDELKLMLRGAELSGAIEEEEQVIVSQYHITGVVIDSSLIIFNENL